MHNIASLACMTEGIIAIWLLFLVTWGLYNSPVPVLTIQGLCMIIPSFIWTIMASSAPHTLHRSVSLTLQKKFRNTWTHTLGYILIHYAWCSALYMYSLIPMQAHSQLFNVAHCWEWTWGWGYPLYILQFMIRMCSCIVQQCNYVDNCIDQWIAIDLNLCGALGFNHNFHHVISCTYSLSS